MLPSAVEFNWPADVELDLRSEHTGGLRIAIRPRDPAIAEPLTVDLGEGVDRLAAHSQIILPPIVFRAAGALPFSGDVTIGQIPDGGATGLLRQGRYSTRQVLFLRSDPVEVQSGVMTVGDRVHVAFDTRDQNRKLFGFVAADDPQAESRSRAFQVVAVSQPARATLTIERYAGASARIAPNWVDRALRDPVLLGVTAILSLIAIVGTVVRDLLGLLRGGAGR